MEVSESPLTCVDLERYGTVLIVDPEREFGAEELRYLQRQVFLQRLNLLIFADWFDIRIFREMSKSAGLIPNNIHSLNKLLVPFGIRLAFAALSGSLDLLGSKVQFLSGTYIAEFPANNYLLSAELRSEYDILYGARSIFAARKERHPVLGFYENFAAGHKTGKIAVFCDSSCLEIGQENCVSVFQEMVAFIESQNADRLESFATKSDVYRQQTMTTESEMFYEEMFSKMARNAPVCKNYFAGDFDIGTIIKLRDSLAEAHAQVEAAWTEIRVLAALFLSLLVSALAIRVVCLQRRRREQVGRELNELRIPKYSVVYI